MNRLKQTTLRAVVTSASVVIGTMGLGSYAMAATSETAIPTVSVSDDASAETGDDPTNPGPTQPTDPVEPTDPGIPTDPPSPTDPTPTDPVEPTDPVDPTNPPTKPPVDPGIPTNPPVDPTDPPSPSPTNPGTKPPGSETPPVIRPEDPGAIDNNETNPSSQPTSGEPRIDEAIHRPHKGKDELFQVNENKPGGQLAETGASDDTALIRQTAIGLFFAGAGLVGASRIRLNRLPSSEPEGKHI